MALEAPPYGIAPWGLNPTNTITEPPEGYFRMDSTSAPTALAVSEIDRLAVDQEGEIFANVTEGDRLVIQQARSASKFMVVTIGAPVDQGTWWEIPVDEIVGQTTAALVDGQDYLFSWRHVTALTDSTVTVNPPAPLVPAEELATLVEAVIVALVAEVKADPVRDADKLIRAANAAITDVEVHLDADGTSDGLPIYSTTADVPARTFSVIVTLGAIDLNQTRFSFGVAGYEPSDSNAVMARGAALALLTTGHKVRFGIG